MSKINEFICPSCGHRWFDSAAYGTCDRCGTFFYLSGLEPTRPTGTMADQCGLTWIAGYGWGKR